MRYAICNETFAGWDHARVCQFVAGLGYQGLELAPFTLAPRITDVSGERRRELRCQAEENGLCIIGLHWLLAKTEGLQLTSPDQAVRARTATYLGELAQHTVELAGQVRVKVADLNPATSRPAREAVTLVVDPPDVVLLPATADA